MHLLMDFLYLSSQLMYLYIFQIHSPRHANGTAKYSAKLRCCARHFKPQSVGKDRKPHPEFS